MKANATAMNAIRRNEFGYSFDSGKRIRAFVLLLRYTGLRIGDVAAMKRDRIASGKLLVRTQKTGSVVHLPLPTIVLEALDALPVLSSDYFFWPGNGLIKSSVADWQRSLRKLFGLAGIKEAHAHRFRDSFSVEVLSRAACRSRSCRSCSGTPRSGSRKSTMRPGSRRGRMRLRKR